MCCCSSSGVASNRHYCVQESIYETGRGGGRSGEIMTVEGAMQKTGLLMAVAMVAAAHTWMQIFSGNSAAAMAALSTSKVDGES